MRGTEGVYDEMVALLESWRPLPAEQQIVKLWLLGLERRLFVELLKTPETQARIRHLLDTGKPLRN